MDLADLKRYFNNVAAEATNEKAALEELATNLATLTTRNAEMAAIIKKLTDEDTQLQQKLKNLENIPQEERGPGQRQPAVVQKLRHVPTANRKSGTIRTTTLNSKKMRRSAHQDG